MSAVLDTNVLIYDTFEDSSHHGEAKVKLDELKKWYIPAIAMHEYVWFMKGEEIDLSFTKSKVVEYVTHEKVEIIPDEVDGILFSAERMDTYHDYNDYVILAVARKLGEPILTFDHRLRGIASKIGVSIT